MLICWSNIVSLAWYSHAWQAEPNLVCIRYKNMRIFPGNIIHGEGFRNEGSPSNFRIQLLIMDTSIRFSNCKMCLQRQMWIWTSFTKGHILLNLMKYNADGIWVLFIVVYYYEVRAQQMNEKYSLGFKWVLI